MGYSCIALQNLDPNGPPSGNLLENMVVLYTSTSLLQFQVPLWKVVCKIFMAPVGLQEEKLMCWIRVKPCFQLSFVLVFPFPRVYEAAELLFQLCEYQYICADIDLD